MDVGRISPAHVAQPAIAVIQMTTTSTELDRARNGRREVL